MNHSAPVIKSLSLDSNTLSGYATTFGNIDSVGEVVMRDAFDADMLARFSKSGWILCNHDKQRVVGFVTKAHTDYRGLFIEAELHSTPEAQSVKAIVKERLANRKEVGLSIGFHILDSRMRADGVRELTKISLFEVSLCIAARPANELAQVAGMKSAAYNPEPHLEMYRLLGEQVQVKYQGRDDHHIKAKIHRLVKSYPALRSYFPKGLPSLERTEIERAKGWPAGMRTMDCSSRIRVK